jgi:hypothetical protein
MVEGRRLCPPDWPLMGQRAGTSASIALIHGMQRLALSVGHRAIVVQGRREASRVTINKWRGMVSPSWELRISPIPRREGSMRSKLNGDAAWHQIRSIETKDYDGIVYDITTPSHDFVVGNATIHNTDDATNYALDNWAGVEHICYPMRFNEQIAFMQPTDPRTIDGELLWPAVWTEEAVAAEERL